MNGYSVLAKYYDTFTQNIDYEKLALKYIRILNKFGISDGLIFDLACGTGNISLPLRRAGYDVTGIDLSREMLSVASFKASAEGINDILFLNQDMRELDLFGTYNAAICALDGLNHLLKPQDLLRTFKRVSLFLNSGGIFVFDINSPKRFEHEYSNNTFVYESEDVFCTWQNKFSKRTGICRFHLVFFEKNGLVYNRSDEFISERLYSIKEMEEYLSQAGFEVVAVYGDSGIKKPRDDDSKYYICARKA